MRWFATAFVIAALLIVVGTAAYFFFSLGHPITQKLTPLELVSLGSYFGGVAGPLLALLTVAGLAITLLMQNRQLEQVAEANIKDQHVRMLLEIGRDLEAMESQHIKDNVTLGSILSGAETLRPHHVDAFKVLLDRYMKILGYYASGVDLYRNNVSPYFDCRAFQQRGLRLLDRVEPFKCHLGGMGAMSMTVMRGHLDGTLVHGASEED